VRWAQDHIEELAEADPAMPEGLCDRAADNWRPLLGIADAAGGEWRQHAVTSIRGFLGEEAGEASSGEQLLADMREIFGDKDRLESSRVVTKLELLEERLWACWERGRCINERQVATLLKPFSIRPKTIRVGEKTPRGYMREDFEDAWARFTPPQNHNTETIQ
jgi:Protein of unknown function (DUF3631)